MARKKKEEGSNILKELQIKDEKGFSPIQICGGERIFKRLSALREYEIVDNNVDVNGNMDLYGLAQDLCKQIIPETKIDDLIIQQGNEIVVGDKTYKISISKEEAFKIVINSQKTGTNSLGEKVMKLNLKGTLESIAKILDEEIELENLSKDELDSLLAGFMSLYDVSDVMTLISFFQK